MAYVTNKIKSSETPATYLVKYMINIPKKVKVGGMYYDIILVDLEDLDDNCGDCNIIKQKIRLNNQLSPEAIEFALWHEICHAWNTTWSEEKVDNIAQMISSIMQNNNLYK